MLRSNSAFIYPEFGLSGHPVCNGSVQHSEVSRFAFNQKISSTTFTSSVDSGNETVTSPDDDVIDMTSLSADVKPSDLAPCR